MKSSKRKDCHFAPVVGLRGVLRVVLIAVVSLSWSKVG